MTGNRRSAPKWLDALLAFAVWGLGMSLPARVASQAAKPAPPSVATIEFTHYTCGKDLKAECRASYSLDLGPGDQFLVKVHGTFIGDFDYTIAGIPVNPSTDEIRLQNVDTTTYTFPLQVHDALYGGYVVTIRQKSGITRRLPDALLVIAVRASGWRVSFAGGFTASGLVNQVYALKDTTIAASGGGSQLVHQVLRRADREDGATPGLATFVHLSHTKVPYAALSFGLGIDRGSGVAYYLGPSLVFGSKGALTVGASLGNIKVLSPGVTEGGLTTDPNAITTLASKNVVRLFVGLSYSFLGSGADALNKPFAGAAGTAGGSQARSSPPTPPADEARTTPSPKAPAAELVADTSQAKAGDRITFTVKITNAPDNVSRDGHTVTIRAQPDSSLVQPAAGATTADPGPGTAHATIQATIGAVADTMTFQAEIDGLGGPRGTTLKSNSVKVTGKR